MLRRIIFDRYHLMLVKTDTVKSCNSVTEMHKKEVL